MPVPAENCPVVWYVSNHQGCPKLAVARYLNRNLLGQATRHYQRIRRRVEWGTLVMVIRGNTHMLYTNDLEGMQAMVRDGHEPVGNRVYESMIQ
jgi:uncharacterized Fe-S cluster-containing protein